MKTDSPWQQIICRTNRQYQQAISDTLEAAGAVSITYQDAGDQPVLEPLPGETPLWNDIIITGLFNNPDNIAAILFSIQAHTEWQIKELRTETLAEQDWERAWMKDFHPMKFGENLWIYPSWFDIPDDDSTKILLDPGLAFGTGTHPTTALCLEWLDQNPPINKTVIDYGCGSGVLAIAATKLGASTVQATDIDEQALLATRDNMHRNNLADELILTCFPEQLPDQTVDLVIANILSGPLVELADTLLKLIKPSGSIVLSGVLDNQLEHIQAAYAPYLKNIQVQQQDDWIRFSGQKRATDRADTS